MGDRWPLSLLLLAIFVGLLSTISALRCRTEDGPSSDEVRKVIQTCMKRITTEADNKTSNENYDDSSYPDASQSQENDQREEKDVRRDNQRGDGRDHGDRDRSNDRNSDKNGDNHQINNRNRKEGGRHPERDYVYDIWNNGRSGRYKRQYYKDGPNNGYGNGYQQNNRYDRERNNVRKSNGNTFHNASDHVERDRACLMQCFFQELKMTNNEGFPDKHKVLHVVTKDLRDNELRDFYTDSIQECFHMVGMDTKLKDKCDYSMKFVTCLADRGRANCNDWDTETLVF